MPETQAADFEVELSAHCRSARLSPVQTEIVELFLVEQMTVKQIRRQLKAGRVSDVQAELAQALRMLAGHVPGFFDAAHAFPRHLMQAVSNRADHDERPRDLRGVTPADDKRRFQGAPMISANDRRLRQDVGSAAKLWANERRCGVA